MKMTAKSFRRVVSVVLAVVMLSSICAISFGSTASAAETKTATYTYNFRNYDAYDYQLGTVNGHRVLSYGGSKDSDTTGNSKDFWNNSSGPTPYGMIVGGTGDFFADTNYNHVNGKMVVRGTYGDDVTYYNPKKNAKAITVKEGYTYNVTIKFVPLNLTDKYKAIKVAIGLVQDTEASMSRAIGTDYPNVGVYYAHTSLRGYAVWEMNEAKNVYRYSKDLIGNYIGDETPDHLAEQGITNKWPVYENGISFETEPDFVMDNFNNCVQTLTCTYKYGETDLIGGEAVPGDLGAQFGILVGSQGASVGTYTSPYLSQIVVTDMTIEVIAPADSNDFNDGDKFHNGADPVAMFNTGETVKIVDGKVAVPDGAVGYINPATDFAVFPGQSVDAVSGAKFDKLGVPGLVTDPALSIRDADGEHGIGIRFRGTVKLPSATNVKNGGGDVGFFIIPAVDGVVKDKWYQLDRNADGEIVGKYCDKLLVVPIDKTMTYDGAAAVDNKNATYQLALTSLGSDAVRDVKFFVGMYTTTKGPTASKPTQATTFTYKYIGCYSYSDIKSALAAQQ